MKANENESKYIKDLKKQIQKLKRENGQLKKNNNKILRQLDDSEYDDEVVETSEEPKKKPIKCSLCSEEIIVFKIVDIEYYRCPNGCSKGRLSALLSNHNHQGTHNSK